MAKETETMSQTESNTYPFSPISCEENNNSISIDTAAFVASSTISTPYSSKVTTDSSFGCSNNWKNAGNTPKKSFKAQNSLDILRNKFEHESQIESQENEAPNMPENVINENQISFQKENETNNHGDKSNNKSIQNLLPQFDLKPERNENSFITLDDLYDSDVDMFEDCIYSEENNRINSEEPIMFFRSTTPECLADYSIEYVQDKSYFAPQFTSLKTNFLELELFNVSRKEIENEVNEIISFLEHSND